MKRKVLVAFFRDSISAHGAGIGGETTLNSDKFSSIEMYTGMEPGMLSVFYRGKEIGVPLSNCRNIVWDEECKSTGSK